MIEALYNPGNIEDLAIDKAFYQSLREGKSPRKVVKNIRVEKRSGKAWTLKAGQICRIVAIEGPQVVDFNLWQQHNPRERFWASRTRQIYGAHINPFDQLWSCLPYFRPLATVIDDSIHYGIDEDGAGCHDLLGTRCDPYVHELLTGETLDVCCHSNLVRAVQPFCLGELDVHDVINIFQVTGLTQNKEQYFVKPCPAKQGDYFEFFAETDLLCALSTCPHGDMSEPIWGENAVDPVDICRPVGIEVYELEKTVLSNWRESSVSKYSGSHGLQFFES